MRQLIRRTSLAWVVIVVGVGGVGNEPAAHAQAEKFATEPTIGLQSERLTLSGDFDAEASVQNPGGLSLLRGNNTVLAFEGLGDMHPSAGGWGIGLFTAFAPRRYLAGSAVASGLEVLRPQSGGVIPSVGTPVRLTQSWSLPMGTYAGLGISWHHYFDDGPLGGLDTFTIGLASRIGRHIGIGLVLRDANAPGVAGAEVQRRYELETTVRPWRDARLQVRAGGRIGEVRGDIDAWVGVAARVARGVTLNATAISSDVFLRDSAGAESNVRDYQAWLGVSLALGKSVVSTWGGGGRRRGEYGFAGAGGAISVFAAPRANQLISRQRLARVVLRGGMSERRLRAAIAQLTWLAKQPDVRLVTLAVDDLAMGWAALRELREAVRLIVAADKPVYAYLVSAEMREYYVASAATKVYVDPAGGLRLLGVASTGIFFRDLIEMLGGEAEFEKIAEYKSAPEMFTEMGPTPPAKQMRDDLVDDLFKTIVREIAHARHMTREEASAALTGGPYTPDALGLAKLIDGIATPDELSETILAAHPNVRVASIERPEPEEWTAPAIGVVYLDADIVDGVSRNAPLVGRSAAGSKTIVAALGALAADRSVKAVVIRINTPGGSALASELISRAIAALAKRKPVICSLGDVAASGGYFAAASCTKIVASPTTITGSIGIFSGKFNVSSALARLGIAVDVTKRGEHADMDSLLRPRTEEEREMVRKQLRYYYDRFVDTVAKGRGLTAAQVDATGRGKVMSGQRALELGLIDQLGGFQDAIALATAQAGLGENDVVRLIQLPRLERGLLGLVRKFMSTQSAVPVLPSAWQDLLLAVPVSLLLEPNAVQARLPYDLGR